MLIRLWKGHHSPELLPLIGQALEGKGLLILCPPTLRDFGFLGALPAGQVEPMGAWDLSSLESLSLAPRGKPGTPGLERAVLGVFTSGTVSGSPRLVLYTRANLEASLAGIRALFDTSRIKAIFCYPQPFHTFGLVLGYVHSLLHGIPLVTVSGAYRRAFHEAWLGADERESLVLGTPTHFHDLVSYIRERGAQPRDSYAAIAGGAKVSVGLWRSMRDSLRIQAPSIGYGATEASPGVSHHPPGLEPKEDGEIGFPLEGLDVKLWPGQGIEFGGASLCLATVQDGALHFPRRLLLRDDIERRESDGMLVYRGRHELLLNRGGQKLSLEVLETLIRSRLEIDAVCVAVPDGRLGEELGVVAATAESRGPAIFELLRAELGLGFDSRRFVAVAELPVTGSSKVDRSRCAELLRERCVYPLSVERIADRLPHRPPAVWIDEVSWASEDEGECSVTLREGARYFTAEGAGSSVRDSSWIEWMAQAYGYARASLPGGAAPTRAFLAAIRSLVFPSGDLRNQARSGQKLKIRVRRTHQLGPLALVEGEVFDERGACLARASLKLYAESG